MKRFVLGLVMVGAFALAAAPRANATAPSFCGHDYAFLVTGTEPVTATTAAATYPLNYVAGVGVLQFGAAVGTEPTCASVGGEMIYIDNDYETFEGGPENCSTISSAEGTLPCFAGTDAYITGGVGPGPANSYTVELGATFNAVVGVGNSADITLPFTFTVFQEAAGATLAGNSNIPGDCNAYDSDFGCGPTAPTPPVGPVLSFTAQRQEESNQGNVPTVYGAAPYLGLSSVLCTGFGGNSTDLVANGQATQTDEATGTYGATSGALSVFSNGYAFGTLTFNSNDDVGNTTGAPNYVCDFQQLPQGYTDMGSGEVYKDGTTNNQADLYDEYYAASLPTPLCRDADAGLTVPAAIGANEVNSSVLWGTSNGGTYTIVTGVATPALLGGAYLPPGEIATCTGLSESPVPGTFTMSVVPATATVSVPGTVNLGLHLANTSVGECAAGAELIPTGTNAGNSTTGQSQVCHLTLTEPGSLTEADSNNYTPSATWTAGCTCTAKAITNASCTGNLAPYGCCTGLHAGTCVAESDTYEIGASAVSPTGSGGDNGTCLLTFTGNASGETPETLTCKN